jgi:heptosyltransferase-2
MGFENLPQGLSTAKRLVVLSPNWLGDAIMALPAVEDIRRAAPRASLVMAARAPVAPLFRLAPSVDDTLVLGGRDDHDHLRSGGFDVAILLPNSFQSALAVWRGGVPERWGYRTDLRGPLLTRAVTPPAPGHQGAYYQHLTRALGIPSGPLTPRLVVGDDARRAGRAMLVEAGWDEEAPLVALAPGAAYGGAKRWPAASFAALARDLSGDGIVPVLIGGPADGPAGAEVLAAAGSGSGMLTLIGQTDLPALGGVLAHCRALVSNDSGAMHFAAAVGVPVTALFGPTDERATHPLGPAPHIALTNPVWCRPCLLRECPLDHRCMRGLTVDSVASATRGWL